VTRFGIHDIIIIWFSLIYIYNTYTYLYKVKIFDNIKVYKLRQDSDGWNGLSEDDIDAYYYSM